MVVLSIVLLVMSLPLAAILFPFVGWLLLPTALWLAAFFLLSKLTGEHPHAGQPPLAQPPRPLGPFGSQRGMSGV